MKIVFFSLEFLNCFPHPFIRQFPCSFNNIWKEKIQNSCMWRINLSWIICKNSTHNNPFSRRKDVQNRFYSTVIFAWKSSNVFYTIWAKCIIIWGEKNITSTTVSFVQLFLCCDLTEKVYVMYIYPQIALVFEGFLITVILAMEWSQKLFL